MKAGVFVVPLPIFGEKAGAFREHFKKCPLFMSSGSVASAQLPSNFASPGDESGDGGMAPLTEEDQRWRGTAIKLDQWKEWFQEQIGDNGKVSQWRQLPALGPAICGPNTHFISPVIVTQVKSDNGLFIGLRLDGRVRSSGQGMPRWARYAAELAPLSGGKGKAPLLTFKVFGQWWLLTALSPFRMQAITNGPGFSMASTAGSGRWIKLLSLMAGIESGN